MSAPPREPWPSVCLGQVAEFLRGVTYKPVDVTVASDPTAIACMRTKNIQADLEDNDLVFIPKSPIKADKILRAGDILVSSANSWNLVGKCCWIPDLSYQATFGGFTSVLRVDPNRAFPRYVYHWFSTDRTQQLARSFGQQTTNIANLNQSRCLELEIPLPSLQEQRRIAAILDKADALRRKRERSLDLIGEMVSTLTQQYLSGKEVELGSAIIEGPTNGLYKPSKDYGDGVPILRIDSFYDGRIVEIGSLKRLRVSSAEMARFQLRVGDIVVNRVNSLEYLGKSALVRQLLEPTVFESNMMRLSLDTSILLPEVCIALLQTSAIRKQILSKAKNAVNQSSINQGDVKSLRIPLPNMKQQRRFVDCIERLELTAARMMEGEAKLGSLFSSLQHRAFSGQL